MMTFSQSTYNPPLKLSSQEMLEISQDINREFALNLSAPTPEIADPDTLHPQEMQKISDEISLNFAPSAAHNAQGVVLLPVDPDHLYAYWNLADPLIAPPKKAVEPPLTLRIYSDANPTSGLTATNPWFDLPINSRQNQQAVTLPQRVAKATYSASVGQRNPDNSLSTEASSNRTPVAPGKAADYPPKIQQAVFQAASPIVVNRASSYPNKSASGQGCNQ
ncbi:MAG: DUF4912 domain-containing protein [Methylococcales bacterium]|nr:DUF4912 domain-containing protein [Methylococcales bacterium]